MDNTDAYMMLSQQRALFMWYTAVHYQVCQVIKCVHVRWSFLCVSITEFPQMRRQSTQNYLKILVSVFFPQNFFCDDCIWELKKPKIHPKKSVKSKYIVVEQVCWKDQRLIYTGMKWINGWLIKYNFTHPHWNLYCPLLPLNQLGSLIDFRVGDSVNVLHFPH